MFLNRKLDQDMLRVWISLVQREENSKQKLETFGNASSLSDGITVDKATFSLSLKLALWVRFIIVDKHAL